jgi:hypothetical protein
MAEGGAKVCELVVRLISTGGNAAVAPAVLVVGFTEAKFGIAGLPGGGFGVLLVVGEDSLEFVAVPGGSVVVGEDSSEVESLIGVSGESVVVGDDSSEIESVAGSSVG